MSVVTVVFASSLVCCNGFCCSESLLQVVRLALLTDFFFFSDLVKTDCFSIHCASTMIIMSRGSYVPTGAVQGSLD